MDILFYKNFSDPITLGKELEHVTTLSGTLKSEYDILNPIINIESHNIINANYCHVPELNRYYFIDKQSILTNNLITVFLKVDVLESYKNEIKQLKCILSDSTSNNDNYLNGPQWVTTVKTTTTIKQFPAGLNNEGEYILITAGG